MDRKGFCLLCGRRFEADPERPHDGNVHEDCLATLRAVTEECTEDTISIPLITKSRDRGRDCGDDLPTNSRKDFEDDLHRVSGYTSSRYYDEK